MTRYPTIHYEKVIAFDTETTGLKYKVDKVFGFSIATDSGIKGYWDIRTDPDAREWFNNEIRDFTGTIVAHNASFDYRMAKHSGLFLPLSQLDDTVIRAACIDEHLMIYSLDALGKRYLGEEKETEIYKEMAALFGGLATRNVQMRNIGRAPEEVVKPYAIRDAILTLQLWQKQEELIRSQDLHAIVEFERKLMPTLIRAEERGIRVDLEAAERAADALTPIIDRHQKTLNEIAGKPFNFNSSPQVREMFSPKRQENGWVACDGTPLEYTPKGNPSLGADALREMTHPAAMHILELRSLLRTRDTFLKGHILGSAVGDRVYPTINQSKGESGGTGTGRLSYVNPAMQQIPDRNKEVAKLVKPCFLPDEGHVWLDADLKSFEVRVFAHLINNQQVTDEYRRNPETDLHRFVAGLTGLPRNAMYSGQANAKQLNLSMIFNSGDGAIAAKMGMPWEWDSFKDKTGKKITYRRAGPEAKEVITKYHQRMPGVQELAVAAAKRAEGWGFITNYKGRRLRFPRGYRTYKASGILIQSTAADLNKENWALIEDALRGEDGHLILNTHDSYSLSLPEDWQGCWDKIRERIEAPRLRIPLLLELKGVGANWWESLGESNG